MPQYRICPICKQKYIEYPAISRKDNTTEICPKCGQLEALEIFEDHISKRRENND